jgi:hypothetical protein
VSLRALHPIARADFLERTRRHAFLVTIALMVWAAFVFLPANHSNYTTLQMAGHRGVYNSAYVGTLVAMMSSIFLTFAGFYVVKNTVDRDVSTGVGEILATTPITKVGYTVGKALSNFAVLAAMLLAVVAAAAVMQWVRAEDRRIDPIALALPFVVLTLPIMAVVAAVAVLFETVRVLRGGLGNVAFFLLWIGGISTSAISSATPRGNDVLGAGLVFPDLFAACRATFPDFRPHVGSFSMGLNFKQSGVWDLTTFRWDGVDWNAGMIAARAAWFGLALAIAMIAAIPFDRFDRARGAAVPRRRGSAKRRGGDAALAEGDDASAEVRDAAPPAHPTLLAPAVRSFSFAAMLGAELRLMLAGVRTMWIVVAIGLGAACAFAPLGAARVLLGVAWIWPLLFWSAMGAREQRHGTTALLFSSPRPLGRQLPAAWLAGVALAVATGAGLGARLAVTGDVAGLFGWVVGALFIPALALASGVWTGSGKLFEVVYLLLWYGGPIERIPFLDFTGSTPGAREAHGPEAFLIATVALLVLAWLGRRRRLRS